MRLLLDTHVFLWATLDHRQLSRTARTLLTGRDDLHLSVVTTWELVIKASAGRLKLPQRAVDFVEAQISDLGLLSLPIRSEHLRELEQLPRHHRDPFDRLLIAQARAEGIPLLSADPQMRRYDVEVLW